MEEAVNSKASSLSLHFLFFAKMLDNPIYRKQPNNLLGETPYDEKDTPNSLFFKEFLA